MVLSLISPPQALVRHKDGKRFENGAHNSPSGQTYSNGFIEDTEEDWEAYVRGTGRGTIVVEGNNDHEYANRSGFITYHTLLDGNGGAMMFSLDLEEKWEFQKDLAALFWSSNL